MVADSERGRERVCSHMSMLQNLHNLQKALDLCREPLSKWLLFIQKLVCMRIQMNPLYRWIMS